MARRLIDGARRDWLSDEQCARWIGVSTTLFHQLVDAGRFPAQVVLGRGGRKPAKWHWLDAVAYMHLRGRGLAILSLPVTRSGAAGRRQPREG